MLSRQRPFRARQHTGSSVRKLSSECVEDVAMSFSQVLGLSLLAVSSCQPTKTFGGPRQKGPPSGPPSSHSSLSRQLQQTKLPSPCLPLVGLVTTCKRAASKMRGARKDACRVKAIESRFMPGNDPSNANVTLRFELLGLPQYLTFTQVRKGTYPIGQISISFGASKPPGFLRAQSDGKALLLPCTYTHSGSTVPLTIHGRVWGAENSVARVSSSQEYLRRSDPFIDWPN